MCKNLETIISKIHYNKESFIFSMVSISSKEYLLGLCSTSDLEYCLTFSQLETAIASIESNISSINDEVKEYLKILHEAKNTIINN